MLYDAMLHAVFLGVISMVFARAPVIFPAVLGSGSSTPAFHLHVGILHLSLILRVVDNLGRWRVWGDSFKCGCSAAVHVQHGPFDGLERKS